LKGFSEDAKKRIREKLIEKGKDIFSVYGLKGTTIRQLAKEAGISSGSFYAFYGTKEQLFIEILGAEIEAAKENNMKKVLAEFKEPVEWIRAFLSNAIKDIGTNPILSRMLIEEERQLLSREYAADQQQGHLPDYTEALVSAIAEWQRKGVAISKSTKETAAIIRALFILSRHRDEIGKDVYPAVMGFYIERIAQGLTDNRREGDENEQL
jgi:AcrR family transcriptional regulator